LFTVFIKEGKKQVRCVVSNLSEYSAEFIPLHVGKGDRYTGRGSSGGSMNSGEKKKKKTKERHRVVCLEK
jgi:hypothetical protein